ncbi:MAG TPA: galactose-1-epimerase [Opitutae bacterium]|nr:galactose-1-epimerase [Opitutae bacterium]
MTKIAAFVISALILTTLVAEECSVSMKRFGELPEGEAVHLYTLTNANGMRADITNYGGIVTRLLVPDRLGRLEDVVLGYDTLEDYLEASPYFGCIVGIYGNRIKDGRFQLEGNDYQVTTNSEAGGVPVHLHGGEKGLDKVLWSARPIVGRNAAVLVLTYVHPDGAEGYPGNIRIRVIYRLTNENALEVAYRATTDKTTIINLTHHSYFNLNGEGAGTPLDHELMINADHITPITAEMVPTGEMLPVDGTPFDFRNPTKPGDRIDDDHPQIELGGGYDHNWVLNREGEEMELAASAYEPSNGRYMEVWTEEPGIQYYSGNFLDGSIVGKSGAPYDYRSGFCLETQHYPDSPNHRNFPSTTLKPGEIYNTRTAYRFSVR